MENYILKEDTVLRGIEFTGNNLEEVHGFVHKMNTHDKLHYFTKKAFSNMLWLADKFQIPMYQ